ncbi:glycosyltransferase family 4 protein [uncultured Corynebacterium sp.]|uniref:glycosyltransferase family 4 protein n=1 Tax=uncultured Corynebacterium sp. TaxID=159447 RepID=UPI0025E3B114|nr:glycosyltransferase family 4 protein [uncultured Corynebacterium sp.]
MKVLLLCWRDSGHPEGGGSEVYLERVAEYLASEEGGRHDVTFRTARYPGSAPVEHRNGVTYVRGGGAVGVYPGAWLHMLRHRFDVIVDTQNGVPFFARVFGRGRVGWSWPGRVPVVLLTHHCHRAQWPVAGPVLSRVGWFVESRLSPWVHHRTPYVTVSAPSADDLVRLGVDRRRITVIRNGVDAPPAGVGAVVDAAEGTGPLHLVTLSRLTPYKRIEHALHALAAVLPDHPGTVLDVIGDGWWSENLRRCAAELGVGGHVVFHGHVTEDVKHRLLAGAAVHLMPSAKEGWGLAVIEAGLHGVPTIGYSSSDGLRDSVVDGRTGLLVGSEGDLVTAVAGLLDDPERRRRLGDAARERARSFSWNITGEAWRKLLENIRQDRR